ncbi:ferritin-like domain-containing protein [Pseudozobellia thermophila]|uniref:DUF2383 domain-containing protein n=1 Tax=Pseudozobellia thermophila TaxID=192903 RepID=A0A1M6M8F1_9FLAO|nr:PA2169 family four-helix-bundle protein [Pseudozobellia thermophila]SHJ79721.1 conserved hypothetical protein [Pseudozobellia thermophila]
MNTYTEKIGSKLNDLLEKTYDAEKGFKKAAENVESITLKGYFQRKAQERYDFGHELKAEIKQFGQEIDKGDSFTSKVHRSWMDLKNFFAADSEEAMLEEAIKGEKAAISEYEEVMQDTSLPNSTKVLLARQKHKIENGLDTIEKLEDLS